MLRRAVVVSRAAGPCGGVMHRGLRGWRAARNAATAPRQPICHRL